MAAVKYAIKTLKRIRQRFSLWEKALFFGEKKNIFETSRKAILKELIEKYDQIEKFEPTKNPDHQESFAEMASELKGHFMTSFRIIEKTDNPLATNNWWFSNIITLFQITPINDHWMGRITFWSE